MELSVSILSSGNREECIKKLNNTNIDYFHIDTMDGMFVDNYQMPINQVNELSKYTSKPLDIHLMVDDPVKYIEEIKAKDISYITIHYEIEKDKNNIIKLIKDKGYKVGMSIKPNTSVDVLIPYLCDIDLILVMSVEPGLGGQKFIDGTINKIRKLRELLDKYNKNIKISVDGGVNDNNIDILKDVGVDIVVSGSYIVNSDNYNERIEILKR